VGSLRGACPICCATSTTMATRIGSSAMCCTLDVDALMTPHPRGFVHPSISSSTTRIVRR
jgi:hypothetical protein